MFLLLSLAQTPVRLYPSKSVFEDQRDRPELTPYLADKASGAAVVICPGGGYGALAMDAFVIHGRSEEHTSELQSQ